MILITGGSGFFGGHLAKRLISLNEEVRILDLRKPQKKILECTDFIQEDIRNFTTVYRACADVDVVYHTVAVLPVAKATKTTYREINVGGTRNILEASLKRGISKIVHISSSAVYRPMGVSINEDSELNPVGDYGRAKLEAEILCREYNRRGLDVTILRPRPIIGPDRIGIFGILFEWIKDGKNVYVIGSGNNQFQMLNVYDLVDACLVSIKKGSGEIFNLGSDKYTTIRKNLETLIEHAGTESQVVSINPKLAKFALRALDLFRLSPLAEWHYLTYGEGFTFDTTKAKQVLGWTPMHRDTETLIDSYNWYLEHYEEVRSSMGTTHTEMPHQRILNLIKFFS